MNAAVMSAREELFRGISAKYVNSMLMHQGGPNMLHDLRKLAATTGERLGLDDVALRRILNHTPP